MFSHLAIPEFHFFFTGINVPITHVPFVKFYKISYLHIANKLNPNKSVVLQPGYTLELLMIIEKKKKKKIQKWLSPPRRF